MVGRTVINMENSNNQETAISKIIIYQRFICGCCNETVEEPIELDNIIQELIMETIKNIINNLET